MDARAHLAGLIGKTIHTIGPDKPNRILEIKGTDVVVATDKSPAGQPVPIAEIQAAIDFLARDSEVRYASTSRPSGTAAHSSALPPPTLMSQCGYGDALYGDWSEQPPRPR